MHTLTKLLTAAALAAAVTPAAAQALPPEGGWDDDVPGIVFPPTQIPPTAKLQLTKTVTVREADYDVPTGITLTPGDWVSIGASGSIWAGVWLTGENGPQGWETTD